MVDFFAAPHHVETRVLFAHPQKDCINIGVSGPSEGREMSRRDIAKQRRLDAVSRVTLAPAELIESSERFE
jgi:hypothetical protein